MLCHVWQSRIDSAGFGENSNSISIYLHMSKQREREREKKEELLWLTISWSEARHAHVCPLVRLVGITLNIRVGSGPLDSNSCFQPASCSLRQDTIYHCFVRIYVQLSELWKYI